MLNLYRLSFSVQLARHSSRRYIQYSAKPGPRPPLAFVFDIDGVLIRGPNPLPAGKRALKMLEGNNPFRTKIPYLLLTNGGGALEKERSSKLSTMMGVEIEPSQCLQAHTILQRQAQHYGDKHILVLGGRKDEIRTVAEHYGFKNVHTPLDVLAWNAGAWPFYKLSESERESTKQTDFSQTPISAIFVFHDPRNWALDVQVICDVIQSGGIIGGPYVDLKDQLKGDVELVFCNPDLIWRADFPRPRLGQGAFKEAFQAVYKALTGEHYPYVQYGKPTEPTYKFAQGVLEQRLEAMYGHTEKPPTVYMIGDNPESDIAGANAAGWPSVLVHTGVYDPEKGAPAHRPTFEAEDVEKAVEWAMMEEFKKLKAA